MASIETPNHPRTPARTDALKRIHSSQQASGRRPGRDLRRHACMHASIPSIHPSSHGSGSMHPSMAGAIQGRLNLLHSGADEAVDCGHRLGVQLRRRQAAHQDLERHRHQGSQRRRRAGPAVGQDGEARRQERDGGRVLAAHHHVRRREIDRRVHHQRPRHVGAALLQDQHAVLARVQAS
uniref:Uncharacterized protein n=1 Tax=Arundo donax TaxID=35708 RepID=A0A0A9CXV8_ARUDO